MAEFGVAVLAGGLALATANYTSCAGFTARHETVHAQQVANMNRLIAEFENAYKTKEGKQEEWELFLILREKAREVEEKYEDSIEMYKETPLYRFIAKWKARCQVQKKKKELRSQNRLLRSHYNSCSSSVSSISGEHGSSAPSSASYTDVDETRVLAWAKQVAESDDGHDSEIPFCATVRLVKKGYKLTRKARVAVRRRNPPRKSGGGEAGLDPTLNHLNANTSEVLQDTAGRGSPESSVSDTNSGTRYSSMHVDPCAQFEESTSLSREPTIRPHSGSGDTLVSPRPEMGSEVSCNDGVSTSVLFLQDVRGGGRCARKSVRRHKAGSDADSEGGVWDSGASNADDEHDLASASFGPIYRTSGQVSQNKICVEHTSTSKIFTGSAQWSGEYDEAYFQVPHAPTSSPLFPQPSTQSSPGFPVLHDMQEQSQHPQHPHHQTIEDHSPALGLGLYLGHDRARFASSDTARDFGQLDGHQNKVETMGEYYVDESRGEEESGAKSLRTWPVRAPPPSEIPESSELNMPSYPTRMLLQHGIHLKSHHPMHHLQHFVYLLRSGLGHGYNLSCPYSGQHISFATALPIGYPPTVGAHANVGGLVAYGGEEGSVARNEGATAQGGYNFYVAAIPATPGESTYDVGGTTTMPAAFGGYAVNGCYAPVHESILRRHPTL